MESVLHQISRLITIGCLLAIGAQAAAVRERLLPEAVSPSVGVPLAQAVTPVHASPVVAKHAGVSKKVEVTITKEVAPGPSHVHPVPVHVPLHNHVMHPPHPPHVLHEGAPHLHLNGDVPIVLDNQTVADLLQQLLAGNIKNVQSHGFPLVLPGKRKPVAVIYSSAIHVVDLGDLRGPSPNVIPLVKQHLHALHNIHMHPLHNLTHVHPVVNHTSLLQTLMAPLTSLAHLGASHAPHTVAVKPVNMQPVMMMVPVAQPVAVVKTKPHLENVVQKKIVVSKVKQVSV